MAPSMRIRPRAVTLVAALVFGAISGCAARNAEEGAGLDDGVPAAEKHYNVALGSFQNGMFSDAKIQLDRALEENPEHGDSYYLRGVIELNEGREMIDALEMETCLTDEAAELQRVRADERHQLSHASFDHASKVYTEQEPGRGRAFNSMAVVSLYFQNYEQAVTEAKEALTVQFYTERYSALSNLGWAYHHMGRSVEAMTELRQAIMLNPDYCVGRYRLAQVYMDYELNDQALEQIEAVVANDRCPIQDAHRVLGVLNLRMGRPDAAAAAFGTCVDLAPRSCLAKECDRYGALAASQMSGDVEVAAQGE